MKKSTNKPKAEAVCTLMVSLHLRDSPEEGIEPVCYLYALKLMRHVA